MSVDAPGSSAAGGVPEAPRRVTLRRVGSYVSDHRAVLGTVVVLSVLGAAATLGQPLLVGIVISSVGEGRVSTSAIIGLVALVLLSGLLSALQHYLLQRTGEQIVFGARRRLVARILHLPISEFDARRRGDLVSRIGSDTSQLRALITQGVVESVGGIVIFVGAIIAMALLDVVLVGVTLAVVAIAVVVVATLSRQTRTASLETQRRLGDLTAAVDRTVGAIRTVRAAGATERELTVITDHARAAREQGIRIARISAFVQPVSSIAIQTAFLTVLAIGGLRVARGELAVAELVTFILFLFMMVVPLGQFFGAIGSLNQALGALARVEEVLALQTEAAEDGHWQSVQVKSGPAPERPVESVPVLEFAGVSFGYPDPAADRIDGDPPKGSSPVGGTSRRALVLDNVSFTVPQHKRTAIVGPSGAGKSTLLALVERFYELDSGSIKLSGRDIRSLERTVLREHIGYVEQEAPVLAGSLRGNLLLGAPDASRADCLQVLDQVGLLELVERDEAGLDARVGDNGIMLSGGERQRLAIARALLTNPTLLLLDESTASLDGISERRLRTAIEQVAVDRTLLVIAHRLSTVIDAEQIVVLDRGQVVGTGTHTELVETVPLYRTLATHQGLV